MRTTTIWRLAALLLLAALFALPAIPVTQTFGGGESVAADDDEDENDEDNGDKRQEKEERNDDRGNDQDNESSAPVQPPAGYRIEVACTPVSNAARTECTFTGVVPEDGKDVSHLVIPEDVVCAGVLDGDFGDVAPDPNTNVTGYRATGNDPYSLVLDGVAATGGAATYWLKAADAVFPATGLGLVCGDRSASDTLAATLEGTAESTPATSSVTFETSLEATQAAPPTTGAVVVSTYACTAVRADTSAYDWYGACDPGGEHRYVLAPLEGEAAELHAAETSTTGEAAFPGLAPGTYDLDDVNGAWCHAESDGVDAEGNVVVEAGAETTVWLFYCHDGAGS